MTILPPADAWNDFVLEINTSDLPPVFTMTTDNVEVANFGSPGQTDSLNDFGYDGESVVCWGVADNPGIDELMLINRFSGQNILISAIGTFNIESISLGIGGSPLYAADANQLGALDMLTGVFTPLPSPFGTGSGSAGNITFSDVDGLTFDPFSGTFFGSHRRTGGGNQDVLLQIDPLTGAHIPDAFGAGVDYVEIDGNKMFLDSFDSLRLSINEIYEEYETHVRL